LSDAHIRWAKCGLTWAYLPSGGYTGSEATARSAIAAVDAQTSFSFGQVPPSAGADITIRWATPQQEEDLAGGTLGYASVTAPSLWSSTTSGTWGLGDRAGLAAVSSGC